MSAFVKTMIAGADGVPLAVFESVPHQAPVGPTLFLVNGLGGNVTTWKFLVDAFAARHRIVTWDYRGLYASRFDPDTRARFKSGRVALDIQAHADDAMLVLDAMKIDEAVFIGWSMGVQLNFELWRAAAPRMAGLVQICGAPGRALTSTVFGTVGRSVIPPAMELFRQAADRYAPWLSRVASSPAALGLAKKAGLVAPSLDDALAAQIVRDYMHLDFEVYNRILLALGEHDATDVLPILERPTLLVAGTRDPMTPPALSKRMAAMLPQSELAVFEGGSHYLPIEFPQRLNETLASFLTRRIN